MYINEWNDTTLEVKDWLRWLREDKVKLEKLDILFKKIT